MIGKPRWIKGVIASFLVLALLAIPGLGCAEDEEGVVITIGELTDFTGPASPAVITIHYVVEDVARYYNDNDLIPGVKIKIAGYDTKFEAAREVPGYEWVKGKGAEVVICLFPGTGEVLKPFAERDKVVITTMGMTVPQLDPPAWNFGFSNTQPYAMKTLMKWVHDEHWDYTAEGRVPKIGFAAWGDAGGINVERAMREYIQDNPGEFEYVSSHLAPVGTATWTGEVEKLKDCDYLNLYAFPIGAFLKEYQARGYEATVIDAMTMGSYQGFFVDMIGWDALDGSLTANTSLLWNESFAMVDLMNQLLYQYRPEEAEDIIYTGIGYVGAGHQVIAIFEILQQAIEEVGAENFDGQAFYNAALKYETTSSTWEGYPVWSFSETKRYLVDHIVIDKFDAEAQEVVRITEWLPIIK